MKIVRHFANEDGQAFIAFSHPKYVACWRNWISLPF